MALPKLLIFASGTKSGGGSGFANLVQAQRAGTLQAEIVGVVSNHGLGGVAEKAKTLGINFIHFPEPREAEDYKRLVEQTSAEFVALSGWLKLVKGLDPKTTFNIHPGPLPQFGGPGMYGHFVHEAILAAFKKGEVAHSAVSMHFVTQNYDEGPIFFRKSVEIQASDTAESLGVRVNQTEHQYQPLVTNLVVTKQITWDGKDPRSLKLPNDYVWLE